MGIMDNEVLILHIWQKGDSLCGYSYDSWINDRKEQCKVLLSGRHDAKKKKFILEPVRFLENSGAHIMGSFFIDDKISNSGHNETIQVRAKYDNVPSRDINMKRVDHNPRPYYGVNCFPLAPEKGLDIYTLKVPRADKKLTHTVQKPHVQFPVKKDSMVTLEFYDSGVLDRDSVTIFINGNPIFKNVELSDKPITLSLPVGKKAGAVQILMQAESVGSQPPATAFVAIHYNGIKREITLSADMKESAMLYFEY